MPLRRPKIRKEKLWSSKFPAQPKGPVYDIVDIGSGEANWLMDKLVMEPHLKVAAVDPAYKRAVPPGHVWRAKYQLENTFRSTVSTLTAVAFMRQLARSGGQIKLLTCHMPETVNPEKHAFPAMMKLAQKVLAPKGKISITSESLGLLQGIFSDAERNGLAPEKPFELIGVNPETFHMARLMARGEKMYRLVISKPG